MLTPHQPNQVVTQVQIYYLRVETHNQVTRRFLCYSVVTQVIMLYIMNFYQVRQSYYLVVTQFIITKISYYYLLLKL